MSTKCFRVPFYCFIALYILFSAFFSSSLLLFYPFLWPLHSQFTQEILSFSPSYLDPCVSLLGSSLLSRISGVVDCRLFFVCLFCFMSKSHLWVNIYDICHSGLPHSVYFFNLDSSFACKFQDVTTFYCWVNLLHCVNIPHFLYPFFDWGASRRLFPGSAYCK